MLVFSTHCFLTMFAPIFSESLVTCCLSVGNSYYSTNKAPTCLLVLMLALHCIALICYNYNAGPDSLFVRTRLIHTKLPMLCTSCLDSTCPCFPSKSQLRLKYKPDFVLFCHVSFNSQSPAEPNLTSENQNIKEVKISKINAGERRKG